MDNVFFSAMRTMAGLNLGVHTACCASVYKGLEPKIFVSTNNPIASQERMFTALQVMFGMSLHHTLVVWYQPNIGKESEEY